MKLGGEDETDAERLYALFVEEVDSAGTLRLLGLVQSFQRDASWKAAPQWAKAAFTRIAEGMR